MNFKSIDELLKYTKNIVGKKFKDIDKNNQLKLGSKKDKGLLGKVVETGFYGYSNNNKAEADFGNLGVELKVSGYVKNKNGSISAKERLVLGKIDYNSLINEEFNYSKLIFKNRNILIIWYKYEKNQKIEDFTITNYQLYDMSIDELIIRNDYEVIKDKVSKGFAHLLSEGDTSYLGACTKGSTSNDRTHQPASNVLAKPRAFSLKNSYMTGILRSMDSKYNIAKYKSVEEYVFNQIERFIGKTQLDIYYSLTGNKYENKIPKNLSKMISDRIIGKDKELPKKSDLFLKTNYIIKNLPVNEKFYPLERMSFRNLILGEFSDSWDNSSWKSYFEEVTIIVLCYKGDSKTKNGYRILEGIKKITFNQTDIDLFKKTYNMVRKTIISRDITKLPYPKKFPEQVLEVAPKGVKGDDAYNNFFKKDITKICFMINKDFVFKKLNEKNK